MNYEQTAPIKVILLSIVTCGIYYYFWIHKTSSMQKDILKDESIDPGKDVLLSIVTCGIYGIFWIYQQGERIQKMAAAKGQQVENEGTTFLILAVVFSPVAIYLVQDKINKYI